MTTPSAERAYQAQHVAEHAGKGWAVFNPHNKALEELPVIYGFNNGGGGSFWSAQLMAEDGGFLGGHCCSHECYMPADLGVLENTRPDRHETFQKHYPEGYRMEFVSYDDVPAHTALNNAFALNKEKYPAKETSEAMAQ